MISLNNPSNTVGGGGLLAYHASAAFQGRNVRFGKIWLLMLICTSILSLVQMKMENTYFVVKTFLSPCSWFLQSSFKHLENAFAWRLLTGGPLPWTVLVDTIVRKDISVRFTLGSRSILSSKWKFRPLSVSHPCLLSHVLFALNAWSCAVKLRPKVGKGIRFKILAFSLCRLIYGPSLWPFQTQLSAAFETGMKARGRYSTTSCL